MLFRTYDDFTPIEPCVICLEILNENNQVIETSLDGKFKDIKGFKIEKREYLGCPKFNTLKKDTEASKNADEFLD